MAEEVQYRIEIQDGQGFEDGEVMVVLDLNGQDLPDSVAQTILELAQNSRHGQLRGAEHLAQIFVEQAQNQEREGQLIEYVTKVEDDNTLPMEGNNGIITEVKIEDIDNLFSGAQESGQFVTSIQDGSQQKIIVHDLAELEQMRVGGVHVLTQGETTQRILVKSLPDLEQMKYRRITRFPIDGLDPPELLLRDAKVEVGVQCEIINFHDSNPDVIVSTKEGDAATSREGDVEDIKNEPLWADTDANAANKPAEPEEAAAVPAQPANGKSCVHCEFTCSQDIELGRHLKLEHKEKKPFACSVCGAAFELELSFQIHLLAHIDRPAVKQQKSGYTCPVCSIQLKTHKNLLSHGEKEHSCSFFTCAKCQFASCSKKELSEHNKSQLHTGRKNKVSICPVCKVACLRLTAHLTTAHADHRPYSCDQCNYRSKTTYAMRTHMLTHTSSKDFVCPQCKRACKSQISLKRHIKNHNPDRKYHCSLCSFCTNDGYEFKRHGVRVHTRKSYYGCKFCNLSFVNHCDLKLHAMSEHKSRDSFYCKYKQCDFSCETKLEFKQHVQTHTGKHRYLCEICDFTTPWRAHLDRHLATHTGLRPFKCEVCGYECREKINLKKHMVIHSEKKPFICSRCPYTCKLKNLLDSHTRIMHTSLKPYACTRCTYTTKTASNLKKHMWIHEHYKPFVCRFCSYTAREKNKLRRHENLKHKEAAGEESELKPHVNTDVMETYSIVFTTPKLSD